MMARALISSLAYVSSYGFLEFISSLGASKFWEVVKKVSRVNAAVHDVYMKDTVKFPTLTPRHVIVI